MRFGAHPKLDAICGEYLVGTLRGGARRRFERALANEPVVKSRLQYWERFLAVSYAEDFAIQPSPAVWRRIGRDLDLRRLSRSPWYSRIWLWRVWAAAATVGLALALALPHMALRAPPPTEYSTVAVLAGNTPEAQVTAALSTDRRSLRLAAKLPVQASSVQSFELWLLPVEGGAPVPLAVMGTLDTAVELPPSQVSRFVHGAKLAVSVEPAGGSPTGTPTGPVILVGEIQA